MNTKLAFSLFVLGLLGVLSLLTMEFPLPAEAQEKMADFHPVVFKLLLLINPMIMLVMSVVIGSIVYKKANLSVPIIEGVLDGKRDFDLSNILKFGVIGGIIGGFLLVVITQFFIPYLPNEFLEIQEKFKPSLLGRFLYGGITEEILMRFGFMSFLVWLFVTVFKSTNPIVYWTAILIAAFFFALGHFPLVFQLVENPSMLLLSYILIGNITGGIVFGWLYWKKGLESAMIGHIFAHVVMFLMEYF